MGGLSIAGSGLTVSNLNYKFAPSGKLQFSGTSFTGEGNTFVPTGGMKFKNSAVVRQDSSYKVSSTGGITLTGNVNADRVVWGSMTFGGEALIGRFWTARGSIRLAGSALADEGNAITGSGGIRFRTTSATASYRPIFAIEMIGGITVDGEAGDLQRVEWGSIDLGGDALIGRFWTARGGIDFGGTGMVFVGNPWIPTGGLEFKGGVERIGRDYIGVGGTTFDGTADYKMGFNYSC